MPLHVSFLWHMHQPDYRDPETGRPRMPWVRLHAARGYYDMARALEEAPPGVSVTVNFVPSLVDQLEDAGRGVEDDFVRLARRPAESLDLDERAFVLKHFFSVSRETGIETRPRYRWLDERRGGAHDLASLRRVGASWSPEELRDLCALFFLAWFGWAAREDFPALAALEAKGGHFTEAEKGHILDLGAEVARRVLPAYRALAAQGRAELSATPYAHPILPLLCDSEAAGRALPERPRPPRFSSLSDARWHVEEARRFHARAFARFPHGMWPAEGSISPEVVPIFAAAGVSWIASDEGNLLRSLDEADRDDVITRAWRLGDAPLDLVFRDRDLSDRIGFAYAKRPAEEAAADLLGRAEALAERFSGEERALFVILDGENPWEHFHDGGRSFLRHVYQGLASRPGLRGSSVGEALAAMHTRGALARLHSGSWIESSFRIWIGGHEENQGWALLGHLRAAIDQARADGLAAPRLEEAERHLHAAQASDWFWWYGDDFVSEEKDLFDGLFRARLRAAYRALGAAPPAAAERPIHKERPGMITVRLAPELAPPLTGQRAAASHWEGSSAAELRAGSGSMAAARLFSVLRVARGEGRLSLRLEPSEGLRPGDSVTVSFHGPGGVRALTLSGALPVLPPAEGAWREVAEVAVPADWVGGVDYLHVVAWRGGLPAGEAAISLRG